MTYDHNGKPDPAPISGFARLELGMAFSFAERADGWPVGPGVSGRAWSCTTPSVQIVQQPGAKGARRYIVLTLFPFRFTDRRHPPSPLLSLHRARLFAFARLRAFAAPAPIKFGRGPGIELARGGQHIGLEVML